MTRDQMIKVLTAFELQYLIENHDATNPEVLEAVQEFFSNGGYSTWSEYELEKQCIWHGLLEDAPL